jgi:hypothetical protein
MDSRHFDSTDVNLNFVRPLNTRDVATNWVSVGCFMDRRRTNRESTGVARLGDSLRVG